MRNDEFLSVIRQSFAKFLEVKTSRSTAKLKDLHGKIAADLKARLGDDFTIKAQGFGNDKEGKISGRYYDKNVDILIKKNGVCVGGVGVKFVIQNYLQNSNNYFENMLTKRQTYAQQTRKPQKSAKKMSIWIFTLKF